jgi:hypothetical protein
MSDESSTEKVASSTDKNGLAVAAEVLDPNQLRALCSLLAGSTILDAAKNAKVDRTTIYRWIKFDPNFRAAYRGWKVEQVESATSVLIGALPTIAEKLAWKAQNGWDDIGMKFVQGFGVIKPPAGAESAQTVKQEIELELRQQQVQLAEQRAELKEKELEHRERKLKRHYRRKRLRKISKLSGLGHEDKLQPEDPPTNAIGKPGVTGAA